MQSERAAALLVVLILIPFIAAPVFAAASAGKTKVAVFPFNDLSAMTVDMRIASMLNAELGMRDFIEPVPVAVVRKKVTEMEPAFLWTERSTRRGRSTRTEKNDPAKSLQAEKNSLEKTGGIYWQIGPRIIEEVVVKTEADFSVHGDISWFGETWTINARAARAGGGQSRVFTASGEGEDDVPAGIEQLATDIAVFIRDGTIVDDIEEEVRRYLGGMYSLPVVISKIESIALVFQDSLPVQAVLLDLYLKARPADKAKVARTAAKVIALYDPAHDEDTRYLLSRSLDPFDILAEVYEENGEWTKALKTREKALEVFSFYAAKHKAGIQRDKSKLKR